MELDRRLSRQEATYFRDQLRAGRAEALRDAEGCHQILYAIERLGLRCCQEAKWFGRYKNPLAKLASTSPLSATIPKRWPQWHICFETLFEEVRRARNDALHQGAYARTLTSHAIQLALVLEDALMSRARTVAEFMVRNVTVAELWQPVSFVRQQMLAESYSYLPLALDQKGNTLWHLVSDYAVATFLRKANDSNGERARRLGMSVRDALDTEELDLLPAITVSPSTPIAEAISKMADRPLLVVDQDDARRLVGILTAHDVL